MLVINGIMEFNEIGRMHMIHLAKATERLKHRGPDYQHNFVSERTGLGHRRLSVIDLSANAHQPMSDASGRYHIVYNGELYNFQVHRQKLQNQGVTFKSESDTEVLLYLYIHQGVQFLQQLNGCFALAILDSEKNELFLARDRFGINPLLYYSDHDKFVFASEMRSLLSYNVPRELDYESLNLFLELSYVPAPFTMLQGIRKLMPGEYLKIKSPEFTAQSYYHVPSPNQSATQSRSYQQQKDALHDLLDASVRRRLVSDVPLGTFLSGGIDSSIVTALASRHLKDLHTFSIGYPDQPYFDETYYAKLVADKFGTKHTVFGLGTQELYQHLFDLWEHLDEPFADSSALPTYILSKLTRKSVTVALSGDGADELFGGYNKHLALQRSFSKSTSNTLIKSLAPLTRYLPKSRNGKVTNKFRQLDRLAQGLRLAPQQRYWRWAGIASQQEALELFSGETLAALNLAAVEGRRQQYLKHLGPDPDINKVLYTDLKLVLPNDMLSKVDWMSMAHGLEVRVPFLDHELVNFVAKLPVESKVAQGRGKQILRDTFKNVLPPELYGRSKQGFEVPLLSWMRKELNGIINNELLSDQLLADQGLFEVEAINSLKRKLHSRNPGDSPARIWGLLVFQKWWQKYLSG